MHHAAYDFIESVLQGRETPGDVVEFGSRNINGTPRDLFLDARSYTGVDILEGPGVDIVAHAQHFTPDDMVDYVVCAGVLEHTPHAHAIVDQALWILAPGGVLIITTVADPWPPHSGVDGAALREGEYYRNVDPKELQRWLPEGATVGLTPEGDVLCSFVKGARA